MIRLLVTDGEYVSYKPLQPEIVPASSGSGLAGARNPKQCVLDDSMHPFEKVQPIVLHIGKFTLDWF